MNLCVNSVIEWYYVDIENQPPILEKVLWIEPGSSESTSNLVVLVNLLDKNALPFNRTMEELIEAEQSNLVRVLDSDPLSATPVLEDEIEPKHKSYRDERYSVIAEIVQQPGISAYIPYIRGQIMRTLISQGIACSFIYKLLRLWWKGGQNKNALLPRFGNCGNPGKRKIRLSSLDKKLGKPSNASRLAGKRSGVPITPRDEVKFAKGIRRYYEGRKNKRLAAVFRLILFDYYNIGYEYRDDLYVPIMPPAAELPTLKQFRYWYNTYYCDPVRRVKKREGETRFNLRHRGITGDATSIASGPGSVYQIDATIADIYLLSPFFPLKIIGRPVIYVVIDVFSRMIVGVTVLLEGPSWYGAMLALDNVVEDKVQYCARFGITIEPEDWPVNALPQIIMADRGEFEGYNADNLVNVLGITVQNTAPYRADWKSIVERSFGIATEKFIKFSPGGVDKQKERGDRDYRLDALYTPREFEGLLLNYILHYNRGHYLDYYRKDKDMIADEVPLFPIDIWNWGMDNRTGHLRTFPRDLVRMSLLPRKEVSVTYQGIRFSHDVFYNCDTAMNENWLAQARMGKKRRITIAYHPHSATNIYYPGRDGTKVEACELTESSLRFLDEDFYSINDYFFVETVDAENSLDRQLSYEAEFYARHNQITEKAAARKKNALEEAEGLTVSAQISGIQANRAETRDTARQENVWPAGLGTKNADVSTSTAVSSAPIINDSYAAAPDYTDQLARNFSKQKIQGLESEEIN
jgi:putative transposase